MQNVHSPMDLVHLPFEIQTHICQYLTLQDLTQVIRANKGLYHAMIPHLWRTIDISRLDQYHRFMTSETKEGLIKHGHLVRTFKTTFYWTLKQIVPDALVKQASSFVAYSSASISTDLTVESVLCTGLTSLLMDGQFVLNNPTPANSANFGGQAAAGFGQAQQAGFNGFNTLAPVAGPLFGQAQPVPALDQSAESPTLIIGQSASQPLLPPLLPSGNSGNLNAPFDIHLLLVLLRHNPGLTVLHSPRLPSGHVPLLKTITASLRCLSSINVDLYWSLHFGRSPTDARVIKEFLEECPPTIQSITLAGDFGLFQDPEDLVSHEDGVTVESAIGHHHPNLRELVITGDLVGQDCILLPFLQGCPNLGSIQTPGMRCFLDGQVAHVVASLGLKPKIVRVDMIPPSQTPGVHGLDENILVQLINLAGPDLQELRLYGAYSLGQRTIQAILSNCQSLRYMDLTYCSGLYGPGVDLILRVATKLEELHTHRTYEESGDFDPTLRAGEMIQVKWACRSLKVFNSLITFVPRPDIHAGLEGGPLPDIVDEALFSGTVEESHRVQRAIYQQLGSLRELQRLGLGCDLDEDELDEFGLDPTFQYSCLSMTLESGLDLLAGLKNLEVLDVKRMAHRIGVAELEWMAVHWPKLHGIRGLFHEGWAGQPGVDEWISEHRPQWNEVIYPTQAGY